MLFKFIGQHTHGRTSITIGGVTFKGDEPGEVTDPDMVLRLSKNPEFEEVKSKGGRPKAVRDDVE